MGGPLVVICLMKCERNWYDRATYRGWRWSGKENTVGRNTESLGDGGGVFLFVSSGNQVWVKKSGSYLGVTTYRAQSAVVICLWKKRHM